MAPPNNVQCVTIPEANSRGNARTSRSRGGGLAVISKAHRISTTTTCRSEARHVAPEPSRIGEAEHCREIWKGPRVTGSVDSTGLGSLEAKIMRVLWDDAGGHLQVREVLDRLHDDLAYTTVMTVLNRLHEKGLLKRRRAGRAWAYKATLSREAHVASTMGEALSVADNRTAALLHFVADLDPSEAAALRQLLAHTDADGATE